LSARLWRFLTKEKEKFEEKEGKAPDWGDDMKPKKEAEPDAGNDMFSEMAAAGLKEKQDQRLVADAIKDTGASADDWDDPDGYYKARLHEMIDDRYQVVVENSGKGVFSNVVKAIDKEQKRDVAIKVVRNNDMMRKAAEKEVAILQKLIAEDPQDKKHIIRLLRTFDYRNHYCMVFECMWDNLRLALKNYGKGKNLLGTTIWTKQIWQWSKQLFLALRLMRKCKLIHADLKPDNVLVSEKLNVIKLADLGSAIDEDDNAPTPYLVSRFYRAPEIILGHKYTTQVDVWAAATSLYELYTNDVLFKGSTNNDMLHRIMEVMGKFSTKMIKNGRQEVWEQHFTRDLEFQWSTTDKVTGETVVRNVSDCSSKKSLTDLVVNKVPSDLKSADNGYYLKKVRQFADFLSKGLSLDYEKRFNPDDALAHPWISEPFEAADVRKQQDALKEKEKAKDKKRHKH
jgi:serine/threonine-protein kinase PRP4